MKREFLFENSCCHGTGMESHFKYQEGMYFQKRDAFFINMYIPSEFSQDDMRLHMECVSQRRQEYELRIREWHIFGSYIFAIRSGQMDMFAGDGWRSVGDEEK